MRPATRSARSFPARSEDLVENYTRLLDAFVYAKFDLGSMGAELRLGRQVVSWGESTFIQNGINVINHFDVSALRVPGSELKEAFLPQEMVNFSLQFTDNLSAQAIYITDWNATVPEPAGSYFSNNDFAPTGGSKVVLGFGSFSDQGVDFRPLGGPYITNFQTVNRLETAQARRPAASSASTSSTSRPSFNNGTEFGLFFLNYHSRLPLISGHTGTQTRRRQCLRRAECRRRGGAGAGGGPAHPRGHRHRRAARRGALGGSGRQPAPRDGDPVRHHRREHADRARRRHGQASNIATHEYALTAGYFTEYPEDIKLIGLSFNTQLQWGGIALQGEVAYRQDVPLQFDDVELLFAALTPFEQGLATLRGTPLPTTCPEGVPAASTLTHCGQLGAFGLDQKVQGWGLYDTYQVQFTATKTFSNILKASQMVLVTEAGVTHIQDMPDKLTGGPNGRGLRFNGPATNVSGNFELRGRHCPTLHGGGLPGAEPRRTAEPLRRCHLLWISRRGSSRISGTHGPLERAAALQLAARRQGHDAGTGRQLRRGPLRPHARRRGEPAGQVGGRHVVDQVRRRRTFQRHQRPRLRRGHDQVLVLIASRGNHDEEITAALPLDAGGPDDRCSGRGCRVGRRRGEARRRAHAAGRREGG